MTEAFGYYFNRDGEVVHKVHSVGMQLDDLESIPHIIAVAGGSSKAGAIEAYFKNPAERFSSQTKEPQKSY